MTHPRRIASVLALTSALLLGLGCGGGGGGGGAAGPGGGPTTVMPGTTLGSRTVPGYAVTVSTLTPVIAGSSTQIRIRIQPEAGVSQPASVEVWAASDYVSGATTIAASPASGDASDWLATVPIPASPVPGLCAWVRLTMADGSVIEVGKDFPLN